MHPEACEGRSVAALGLCDLVLVVGEDEVLTAAVDVDGLAQIFADLAISLLIERAKEEIERGEMSGPCVSAIINSTKELNAIFAVGAKTEGQGVLEDILDAVRGANND